MITRIEIRPKKEACQSANGAIIKDILDLNITAVKNVENLKVYLLQGSLSEEKAFQLARELFSDPLTEDVEVCANLEPARRQGWHDFDVTYNHGVMDPVEDSALKAIRDLGIDSVRQVRTARRFIIQGDISEQELRFIQEKLLYNKVIEHIVKDPNRSYPLSFKEPAPYRFSLIQVDLLGANEIRLKEISRLGQLFLNLAEMKTIQSYFRKLKRNPTDCELETIAQTWSEHCGHKTFKGRIDYKEETIIKGKKVKKAVKINNLLKSTIMKATARIKAPWCVSVFVDNAGIVRFDKDYNICFKVETHNHPSAIEPFGGANTGLGGVIRDCLGTGLGARPVLNTDVFCFAHPEYDFSKLPEGVLHPKRVMKGVVSGVRDYGNKMGIPTVNGAVVFDDSFLGNPLVFCGTAGILPSSKSFKNPRKGDLVVLVGGRTGRDGIHGATFSSGELTVESEQISNSAVQIGNPIEEKKVLEALMRARDESLYTAITDCGGGGLSSAVGEMGKDLGVRVDLEKVPLKYHGLSYTEIWISEAQERMILSAPKKNLERLQQIFQAEDVEISVIGEFNDSNRLKLFYNGNCVCDLAMEFLHDGVPLPEKKAYFKIKKHSQPALPLTEDLTGCLLNVLSDLNVCSKEWIIRQYDHEVQAGSVIKPLDGRYSDGPSDAAVVRPRLDSKKAVAVSCAINTRFGLIDPYWMAASCIDEALRNIICVGADMSRTAILDNFCWGNPDKPDRLGSLVRASLGCLFAASAYKLPFISGKDSLNNEFKVKDISVPVAPTLLISAISVVPDASKAVSMYAKSEGSLIYIVGNTRPELAGGIYFKTKDILGNSVPRIYPKESIGSMLKLSTALRKGLVLSCHDCSEGGLAAACAEMAFSGDLGMDIFLNQVPYKVDDFKSRANSSKLKRNDYILFSESNSRFIVEVPKDRQNQFEKTMSGTATGLIGCVNSSRTFKIFGIDDKLCIDSDIEKLKQAWQRPLGAKI